MSHRSPETEAGPTTQERGTRGVSRRDFFKLSGATAGVAVAAGATAKGGRSKAFAEAAADAADPNPDAPIHKRPWWVREVDEPTTEIDWGAKSRISERERTLRGPGGAKYLGEERNEELSQLADDNKVQRILDEEPGYTLRDWAMRGAFGGAARVETSFLAPEGETPDELGVPRWEGTPSENANMVRAAMRHMGASTVGFVELNEDTKKLIYSEDPDGKKLEFEDVDEAYETDDKRVIPEKAKWVIIFSNQMSEETMRRCPSALGSSTTGLTYARGYQTTVFLQNFLRTLGYQGLGYATGNALGIAPAFGVLAGLGEMGRHNRLITPEFGPMVRLFNIVTDLPLEPTKPIDAGILDFCKSCKLCAEQCPGDAISYEDEPFWETVGEWNEPGHKAWFEDSVACREYQRTGPGTNCGICFSVCPYAKKDETFTHTMVKATAARTGLFNGMFTSMDQAFGYGERGQEEWWDLDLAEYGIDTQRAARQQA